MSDAGGPKGPHEEPMDAPPDASGPAGPAPLQDEPVSLSAAASAATPAAVPAPRRSVLRLLRDYLETVLVSILVVLFATTFAVQNSVIPSASMEDTLLIGDYILVNKVIFSPMDAGAPSPWMAMRPLRHDDVVVFKYPSDPGTDYIKRVVGLPGDVIEVRDKVVWRNGRPLDEPWAVHRTTVTHPRGTPDGPRDNFGPVTVPAGMLFMMGDNRDYSRDSREFGFVPRELVTGRAFVVFWSRSQPPGAFRHRAPGLRIAASKLRTFHRDVRWERIFTVVR